MTLPHRTVKLYLYILILLKGLLTRKDNHMIKRDLKDNFQISISGQDTWYGMTYHEDVAAVKDSFKKMLENGVYKADLFSDLK